MNDPDAPSSTSHCKDSTHLAERELSAFTKTVKQLLGPEQAQASTQDWLHEVEMMDFPRRSTAKDWRSVTIAVWARLASRIDVAQYRHESQTKPPDTEVSPIPSSNCLPPRFLV